MTDDSYDLLLGVHALWEAVPAADFSSAFLKKLDDATFASAVQRAQQAHHGQHPDVHLPALIRADAVASVAVFALVDTGRTAQSLLSIASRIPHASAASHTQLHAVLLANVRFLRSAMPAALRARPAPTEATADADLLAALHVFLVAATKSTLLSYWLSLIHI